MATRISVVAKFGAQHPFGSTMVNGCHQNTNNSNSRESEGVLSVAQWLARMGPDGGWLCFFFDGEGGKNLEGSLRRKWK